MFTDRGFWEYPLLYAVMSLQKIVCIQGSVYRIQPLLGTGLTYCQQYEPSLRSNNAEIRWSRAAAPPPCILTDYTK